MTPQQERVLSDLRAAIAAHDADPTPETAAKVTKHQGWLTRTGLSFDLLTEAERATIDAASPR